MPILYWLTGNEAGLCRPFELRRGGAEGEGWSSGGFPAI